MPDARLAELVLRLPELRVLTAPNDLEHYGRDWTRRWQPAPLAIVLPPSVQEVQAIVHWANERRVAIVPSGGRTGLSGGAVAADGELVLSLERMHHVLDFDAVDQALQALEAIHPRKVQVVECRFFGGLSVDETAAALQVSTDTVKRDWRFAKLWLLRELSRVDGP